mmetsp:Transcript_25010/g.48872  ORF Transcript_25010/g.48872 Transcript_25010/m.48872 type:complete len:228 (-) Transcript_25010:91-774(-)
MLQVALQRRIVCCSNSKVLYLLASSALATALDAPPLPGWNGTFPCSGPRYDGPRSGSVFCFCQLAQNPACNHEPCTCPEGCDSLVKHAGSVTFKNFDSASGCANTEALLTIPRAYFSGMSDLKNHCPRTFVYVLAALFRDGFTAYQSLVRPSAVRQCIHREFAVSVRWLHLHTVCKGGSIDGMPNPAVAICGTMNNANDALSLAKQFDVQLHNHTQLQVPGEATFLV